MKLLLILLLLPLSVSADKLIVGGVSKHLKGGYNEIHPAIGYQKNSYTLAIFYNSYRETSVILARDYKITKDFSYRFGLASGYERELFHYHGIIPVFQIVFNGQNHEHGFSTHETVVFKLNL